MSGADPAGDALKARIALLVCKDFLEEAYVERYDQQNGQGAQ